jgi:hypothetical protein
MGRNPEMKLGMGIHLKVRVRPLTRLAEKIYMMLYKEESKELDGPRRYLQDGP